LVLPADGLPTLPADCFPRSFWCYQGAKGSDWGG
jgi:hypothetical protein